MRPGELNKEILRLSLPAIASNITVPLLSLSDTAISGHIGDFRTLGAISAGSMMFNTAFWLFGFLRMGTAGMTAQAFGKKDERLAQTVFSQALAIAILSGLLLWAFSSPLSRLLCAVISPSADVAAAAIGYFRITIMCAPALLGIMAFNGWFFGMQSALYPMIIAIFTNLLNIALSITLVFWTDAGFEGVAIGTAAANWCGLVLAFILAVRFMKRKRLLAKLRDMADLSLLRRFFKVNSDIFLRSGCIMCVSLAITSFGARQGDLQLATNAVMMQFFILFSYFMDGIAFSAESLCGRFAGACDGTSLKLAVRQLLIWGFSVMLLFTGLYLSAGSGIAGLITSDADVLENVRRYSAWVVLIPPVTVLAFIFDGIFIGLTATRSMLAATVVSTILFFIVSLWHPFSPDAWSIPDNTTLWNAFLAYLLMRGIILAALTPHIIKPYTTAKC